MILQTMDIKYILQHILPSPEMLGITCAYIESETVRYKQYGSYDAVAVQREGVRLLALLDEVEQRQDARLWRKWQSRYQAWQKKLTQIKFQALVHGEFNEAGEIILYVNALRAECAKHNLAYAAYYQSVLVHERLHYLEHQAVLQKYGALDAAIQSAEYKNAQAYWFGAGADAACVRTVKETLAEFGRFLWCREQGYTALANQAVGVLAGVRAYYPCYPYAGMRGLCALYEKNPIGAAGAWEELWQASLTSWQAAYRLIKLHKPQNKPF